LALLVAVKHEEVAWLRQEWRKLFKTSVKFFDFSRTAFADVRDFVEKRATPRASDRLRAFLSGKRVACEETIPNQEAPRWGAV
jgi:hypothetical protein